MNAAAQSKKQKKQQLKRIKYGIILISVILGFQAVRNAVLHQNITYQIDETETKTKQLQEQINYEKNFLRKYLESPRFDYFFAREQNEITEGDQILIFLQESDLETERILRATEARTGANTPPQKRQEFLQQKRRENSPE